MAQTESITDEEIRNLIPDILFKMRYHLAHSDPWQVIWFWKKIVLYLWLIGRFADLIECETYVLSAAKQIEAEDLDQARMIQALASIRLAQVYMNLGDLQSAGKYIQQAETVWDVFGAGEFAGPASFLPYQARLVFQNKDYATAINLSQQALQMTEKAEAELMLQKEPVKETQIVQFDATVGPIRNIEQLIKLRIPIYNQIAAIHTVNQDYKSAYYAYKNALIHVRLLPKRDKINYSLASFFGLGNVLLACSNWERARRCYNRCLDWTSDATRPSIRAGALFGLAKIAEHENQLFVAINLAEEAVVLYETAGRYGNQDKVNQYIKTVKERAMKFLEK